MNFVAVGHFGARIASADGVHWKHLAVGKEGEVYRAVAFGNRRFVAVGNYGGDNITAASEDGITWKTAKQDAKYANFMRGLAFGKERFVAIGGDPGAVGGSRPFLEESTDGNAWGLVVSIPGNHILRRLAFGNGLFVGVGDRGRRSVSADLRTWKDSPDTKAIDTLVDVAFGKGIFVGVGLHGLRMSSKDGITWSNRQLGEEGEHLNSVVWADDRFVAVGIGATYVSPDGVSWKRHDNRAAPTTCAFGAGDFVGLRYRGRILRSSDGITWEQVHQCEHHLEAIACAKR